jgi:hypothetical protein
LKEDEFVPELPSSKTTNLRKASVRSNFNPLFEDIEEVTLKNVFSISRCIGKLSRSRINHQNKENDELLAMDGLKVFAFCWFMVLLITYSQLDLFYRNKWKIDNYIGSH